MSNSDTTITSRDLPAILIGGAPGVGKSVLTYNLTQELRERKIPHCVLRASTDGEGDWFIKNLDLKDQELVALRQILRDDNRVEWTDTFRKLICQDLSKRMLPLIVDIGGKPQPEDNDIFHTCTDSILLLKDDQKEVNQIWHHYTRSNSLQPLAELRPQSSEPPANPIWEPVLMGTLMRDELNCYGPVFKTLVKRVKKLFSTYTSDELTKWHLSLAPEGSVVIHLEQELDSLDRGADDWTPSLIKPLLDKWHAHTMLSVYGRGPAWLYGALALHARTQYFYQFDRCLGWIDPPSLKSSDTYEQPAESPISIEPPKQMEEACVLTIHLNHGYIDYRGDEGKFTIPELPPDRGVILSGKLPLWLFTALARFYAARDVPWIALNDASENSAYVIYSRVETPTIGERLVI